MNVRLNIYNNHNTNTSTNTTTNNNSLHSPHSSQQKKPMLSVFHLLVAFGIVSLVLTSMYLPSLTNLYHAEHPSPDALLLQQQQIQHRDLLFEVPLTHNNNHKVLAIDGDDRQMEHLRQIQPRQQEHQAEQQEQEIQQLLEEEKLEQDQHEEQVTKQQQQQQAQKQQQKQRQTTTTTTTKPSVPTGPIIAKQCIEGVAIWKTPSSSLYIDHNQEYSPINHPYPAYCICPQGYDPVTCKQLKPLSHKPSANYAKRALFPWKRYWFSQLHQIEHTSERNDLANRYLQSTSVPSIAYPLMNPLKPLEAKTAAAAVATSINLRRKQTSKNSDQEAQVIQVHNEHVARHFPSKIDQFFLHLALRNQLWTHDDRVSIGLILQWNQQLFDSFSANLTNVRTAAGRPRNPHAVIAQRKLDFFQGADVKLGKFLYVYVFSKCSAMEMMKHIISATYSPDHYYVLFMAHNMIFCWENLEEFVRGITQRFKTNNFVIVPEHYSFMTRWASMSLVHMNFVAVSYAYLNGMVDWSHEINLSEANFPLSTPEQFSNFIRLNHGIHSNFVAVNHQNIGRHRFVSIEDISLGIPSGLNSREYKVSGGSQWKVVSNTLWRLILSTKIGVRGLLHAKFTNIPDELIIQTMIETFMIYGKKKALAVLVDGSRVNTPPLVNGEESLVWISWVGIVRGPHVITDQFFDEIVSARRANRKFFARKLKSIEMANKLSNALGIDYRVPPVPKVKPAQPQPQQLQTTQEQEQQEQHPQQQPLS